MPFPYRIFIAYCLYRFIRNGYLNFALITVFFLSHGIDFGTFIFLDGIYFLSKFFGDVINGYISDRIGRRPVLISGCVGLSAAVLLMVIVPTFPVFIFTQILTGYSQSIQENIAAALLYDILQEQKQTKRYLRFEAFGYASATAALALATVLGGIIASWAGIDVVWFATAGLMMLAIFPLFILPEPLQHLVETENVQPISQRIHQEFLKLHGILSVIATYAILFTVTRLGFWFLQNALLFHSIDVYWFGIATSTALCISTISSILIGRTQNKKGETFSFQLIALASLFQMMMAFSMYVSESFFPYTILISIFGLGILHGTFTPLLLKTVNMHVSTFRRATSLGIMSATASLGYVLCSWLIKILLDFFEIFSLLLLGSIFLAIISIGIAFFKYRSSKQKIENQ